MDMTVENIARILKAHDSDRMECSDHDKKCCPSCEVHGFANGYQHQAEALLKEMGLHYLADPDKMRCGCGHVPDVKLGESKMRAMDKHIIEMAMREVR